MKIFAPVAQSEVFWLVLWRPLFIPEKLSSCCSVLHFWLVLCRPLLISERLCSCCSILCFLISPLQTIVNLWKTLLLLLNLKCSDYSFADHCLSLKIVPLVAQSYVFWLVLFRPLFISEKLCSCCSILHFLISALWTIVNLWKALLLLLNLKFSD